MNENLWKGKDVGINPSVLEGLSADERIIVKNHNVICRRTVTFYFFTLVRIFLMANNS